MLVLVDMQYGGFEEYAFLSSGSFLMALVFFVFQFMGIITPFQGIFIYGLCLYKVYKCYTDLVCVVLHSAHRA